MDLILLSPPKEYKASRILLAKFSRYFYRVLRDKPLPPSGVLTLDLPLDPNNRFQSFLDTITVGKTDVTAETIGPLLRIAGFYECPDLAKVFRHFVDKVVNDTTVLRIIDDFLKFDLHDDAIRLIPRLAQVAFQVLQETSGAFRVRDLFTALTPAAFATLLKDPGLQDIDVDRKVCLIDDYVAARGPPSPEDSESLASVVNWNSGDSTIYLLLVRHKCDWLPARFAVPLLSQILEKRRLTLKAFTTDASSCAPKVSSWYVQGWVRFLRDARPRRTAPEFPILTFISTIGESTQPVNPFHYGFLKVLQVGKIISPAFNAATIFEPRKYFMAIQEEPDDPPAVIVDLGTAKIAISSVSIDTRPPEFDEPRAIAYPVIAPAKKVLPESVHFRIAESVADVIKEKPALDWEVRLRNGMVSELGIPPVGNNPASGSVLAVRFSSNKAKEAMAIARLNTVEVKGSFLKT